MTREQFQKKYHEFKTMDFNVAKAEADKVQVEGDKAVVVEFPKLGFCLMLESARNFLLSTGVR